jgi:hypothetical protein
MNKRDAQIERARLQSLLDAYEAGRVEHRTDEEPLKREATPDRAGNVRTRIAHLDEVIAQIDDAEGEIEG